MSTSLKMESETTHEKFLEKGSNLLSYSFCKPQSNSRLYIPISHFPLPPRPPANTPTPSHQTDNDANRNKKLPTTAVSLSVSRISH